MNPFTLLKEDHTKFKAMLSDLEATTDRAEKTRTQIFAELKHQLVAHEAVEEEISIRQSGPKRRRRTKSSFSKPTRSTTWPMSSSKN